ncbi:hypothetical protein Dimus_038752 [Dionaea muscipula]
MEDVLIIEKQNAKDWRTNIKETLSDLERITDPKSRLQALNFVLIEGELFKKRPDGILLRCVSEPEAKTIMTEVHEGVCGAHQAGVTMRWLIMRSGYYWPTMGKDCVKHAKGCLACQRHGPIQRAPAQNLAPIIKPWSFRGWAIDLIGKIYPPSSKRHTFIIVATDFFTKWVEAIPLREITQEQVIRFITEHIIYKFGIPQTIMVDNGPSLNGERVRDMLGEFGVRLVNSTPYYAQSNGQAEASNKMIKGVIRKLIDKNPRVWHEMLPRALWALRTTPRATTGITPFQLVYGMEAVVPTEVVVESVRVMFQDALSPSEYAEAMTQSLLSLEVLRLEVLNRIKIHKARMTRYYNKKVMAKSFAQGELVWKVRLPLDTRDPVYGKWSPNWEGPYMVDTVLPNGAYHLSNLEGELHCRSINGRYLKRYVPSVWDEEP